MRAFQVLEGDSELRGPIWDPSRNGTHFSVFSPRATSAYLALFDSPTQQIRPIELRLPTRSDDGHWCGFIEGVKPGQLYCFRVEAKDASGNDIGWDPMNGPRINDRSHVMDPEAWAIGRMPLWRKGPDSDLDRSMHNNLDQVGLACVIDSGIFNEDTDTRPYIPWRDTTILEAHVRDLTMRHPDVPYHLRGTYSALAHPAIIDFIKSLGTTLQIQPVMAFPAIGGHWGYMTIGFMAPHDYYSQYRNPSMQCLEFKETNIKLHKAGIEVILDFVPNHSGEGGCKNPAMCFRGLANEIWYRLCGESHQPFRQYYDYTGCGNTFNFEQPQVRAFFLRVLKHWARYYHVDGFRFDLAGAVFLTNGQFDPEHQFFKDIAGDPLLRDLKWVAEPWDANGNVNTARFPRPWHVTNGEGRDDIRRFIKAGSEDKGLLPRVAKHLAGIPGSLMMFGCHDGFTMADLLKFNHPHNAPNEEESGERNNFSWNCGHEGNTDDPKIKELRRRIYRFMMALSYLSSGPRLICSGDPILDSRDGNNNVWKQDNGASHLDWSFLTEVIDENDYRTKYDNRFLKYCQGLAKLRKENHQFCHWTFSTQHSRHWFSLNGNWMKEGDWQDNERRSIGVLLEPSVLPKELRHEQKKLILLINSHYNPRKFTLPSENQSEPWRCILNTSRPNPFSVTPNIHRAVTLQGRSLAVIKATQ